MSAFSFSLFGPTLTPLSVPTAPSRSEGADGVYARRMRTVLGKGFPVRDAKPYEDEDGVHEVHLGDACYLDNDGRLRRLWNIIWPERDPDYAPDEEVCPSLRAVFPQFYAGRSLKSRPSPVLGHGYLWSKGGRKKSTGGGISAPIMSASAGSDFKLEFEQREGAVLLLHDSPLRETLATDSLLKKYIAEHGTVMHDYVKGSLEPGLQMEELIFVTGTLKTGAWDSWTFMQSSSGNSISFNASVPNIIGAKLNYSRSFDSSSSPAYAWGPRDLPPAPSISSDAVSYRSSVASTLPTVGTSPEGAVDPGSVDPTSGSASSTSLQSPSSTPALLSPSGTSDFLSPSSTFVFPSPQGASARTSQQTLNLPANQCLLVSGYKFKHRLSGLVKRLRGAASPVALPYDRDDEDHSASGAANVNASPMLYYHPLDALLDYILLDENVDLAIAHDEDLDEIFPADRDLPDDLELALRLAAPRIHVDEDKVGTVYGGSSSGVAPGPSGNSSELALGADDRASPSDSERVNPNAPADASAGSSDPARSDPDAPQSDSDAGKERASEEEEADAEWPVYGPREATIDDPEWFDLNWERITTTRPPGATGPPPKFHYIQFTNIADNDDDPDRPGPSTLAELRGERSSKEGDPEDPKP